tara:strand:- start:20 stop:457 length:438 start_codon:yes stop_codon:yes gene_type:complete
MNKKEIDHLKDVCKQVKEIRHMVEREEKMLARQLKPRVKLSQRIIQWILNTFGVIYILIERYVEYTDDDVVLGMPIDKDLQTMSRKNLCRYMDAVLPERGFFDIQSTSKIRLGCQLLREYKQLKKNTPYAETDGLETGAPGDYDF